MRISSTLQRSHKSTDLQIIVFSWLIYLPSIGSKTIEFVNSEHVRISKIGSEINKEKKLDYHQFRAVKGWHEDYV